MNTDKFKFIRIGDIPAVVRDVWVPIPSEIVEGVEDGIYADYCLCHPQRGVKVFLVEGGYMSLLEQK